ncbi:DUF1189 domain-containing protein [Mobilitalea sibirica]|uniref:DUF1189 domain-containing protein n=1 Tax=Mobilitalea sibirica TaxID=1462919 RepID=A0A8J7H7K9_9FIRM|nr:DUF1189 domain-containing protein [Mobilitalea sibirica]MBH1939515.1 DUF1189 domain-containing protein [Mobilitalea sibirica]
MENTKMNFFQQIHHAITKPREYYKLTKVSGARLTGFVFLFVALTTIIGLIIPMYIEILGPNGFVNVLDQELPEFQMKDGRLYVSERYETVDDGTYILVDTDVEAFELIDVSDNYDQAILISKSNIISKQLNGRIQSFNFSQLYGFDFDDTILQTAKPFLFVLLMIGSVLIYLFMVGAYYFRSLLYSIFGMLVATISKTNLPFKTVFRTAVYSKVTIHLLYTVIDLFLPLVPDSLKNLLALAITSIYIVYGILSHKSEEAASWNRMISSHSNSYHDNESSNSQYDTQSTSYDNSRYNNLNSSSNYVPKQIPEPNQNTDPNHYSSDQEISDTPYNNAKIENNKTKNENKNK